MPAPAPAHHRRSHTDTLHLTSGSVTMLAVWFMTWPKTAALLVALLWLAISLLMYLGTGAAVRVCVCVRERGREREKGGARERLTTHLASIPCARTHRLAPPPSAAVPPTARPAERCVRRVGRRMPVSQQPAVLPALVQSSIHLTAPHRPQPPLLVAPPSTRRCSPSSSLGAGTPRRLQSTTPSGAPPTPSMAERWWA